MATPVGELLGHSDSVNQLLYINETSFASCGSDKLVLSWKVKQFDKRKKKFEKK